MVNRQGNYDMDYNIQAVELAKEIGGAKAVKELGIPGNILYTWTKAAREGREEASAFFAASRRKFAKGRE